MFHVPQSLLFDCFTLYFIVSRGGSFVGIFQRKGMEGRKGYKGEWKGIKGSRDGVYSPSASREKAEGLARTQAGVQPLLKSQESILKPRRGGRIILSGLRRLNTNVHYSQGLHPCLCSCQAFGLRCRTLKNFVFSFVFRSLIRTSDFVEGTCARESKIKNFVFSFVFRSLIRTFAERIKPEP